MTSLPSQTSSTVFFTPSTEVIYNLHKLQTIKFVCQSSGCELAEKPFTGEDAEIQYKSVFLSWLQLCNDFILIYSRRHLNKHKLLCPHKDCPRSRDGKGFSRADNFKTHMKGHEGSRSSTPVLTGRIQRLKSPGNDVHKEAVGALQKILLDTVAQLGEFNKQFGDSIGVVNKQFGDSIDIVNTPLSPPKEEHALSP
jgi:hypothetical protein